MKTLRLDIGNQPLEFEQVALEFRANDLRDRFAHKTNKTLGQTIASHRYQHLAQQVSTDYAESLNEALGEFLQKLKQSGDNFYKNFLNAYGDDAYCVFQIASHLKNRGLYCYTLDNEIFYIGRCKDNFMKRINYGYGQIQPKNCYLDGRSTNCRMNSLINSHYNHVEFYVCCMDDVNQITTFERQLIQQYQPHWNISLRHE